MGRRAGVAFISLLAIAGALLPSQSKAGVLDDVVAFLTGGSAQAAVSSSSSDNLQTMALPQPAMNIDPISDRGGGGVTIVDDSALVPEEGPSGTISDIEKPANPTISTYVVQKGDTLSSIAAKFNVSEGTILSTNDLSSANKIQVGQKLVILPITDIPYTVKSGDTLETIAQRYGGDPTEIANYNGVDDATLAVGSTIIIPNGEVPASATVVKSSTSNTKSTTAKKSTTGATIIKKTKSAPSGSAVFANNPAEPARGVGAPGTAAEVAYYIAPLSHYVCTQGIHGYNAVDLAAPSGTPIVAAAAGTVVVAQGDGAWNGGYGNYVVISHDNGSQTLYGHMSKVASYDGETVQQGQVIGYVGETGEATGPHVHFEIRSGIENPFAVGCPR